MATVRRQRQETRRTQAERRAETRRALLEAGRALFVEPGYRTVTSEAIVERAGVTRGALYYHFSDGKEALFEAVLEELEGEIDSAVLDAAQAVLQQTDDPSEAFLAGTGRFLHEAARLDVQQILLIDGPAVLGWDRWYAIDTRHAIAQIERGLEMLMAAGVIATQPVTAIAHVWYGATMGAARFILAAEERERARHDVSGSLRRLFAGLLPDATVRTTPAPVPGSGASRDD